MNSTPKLTQLIKEWNKLKAQEEIIKEERTTLRSFILKEVEKAYPDKTRSARIQVGEYNVIRSVALKFKWDLSKLKKAIGEKIYKDIIKVKESVDEKRLEEKIKTGQLDQKTTLKACTTEYQERLLVNVKNESEEDSDKE